MKSLPHRLCCWTALALLVVVRPLGADSVTDVMIRHAEGEPAFAGTLVVPPGEGPHPAALLVSPAGDHPRDELRSGGRHLADLAQKLADAGIASLRVDNRGVGGSRNETWRDWDWSVSIAQLAQDLSGHFAWLRSRPEIDMHRVGVVAHGDGIFPAARWAADLVPGARRPAFAVLLSASGRSGVEDLVQRMARMVPAPDSRERADAEACLHAALTGLVDDGPTSAVVESMAECMIRFGLPEEQAREGAQRFAENSGERWHRDYLGQDPLELYRLIEGPVLVVWADDDDRLDAGESEARISAAFRSAGRFNARWARVPGGGHFLQASEESMTLRDDVVDRLIRFVTEATGFDRSPVPAAPEAPAQIVLADVAVVDVERGELLEHRWVTVRDGVIAAIDIARPASIPAGAREIDGRDRFLIPGLWDSHVHLSMYGRDALPRFVRSGVTTVRDMGGDLRELREWRERADSGAWLGPRILLAGPFLDGDKPNDIYRRFVREPDDVEAVVDDLIASDVDFLKVHTRLPVEVFERLAEVAADRGIGVAGHVPAGMRPLEVSNLGIASIEHTDSFLSSLARARINPAKGWGGAREWWLGEEGAAALERIAANGTVVVSSLAVVEALKEQVGDTAALIAAWTHEITGEIHAAGIPIAAGTDTARRLLPTVPGEGLHRELQLLVECGLTPADALRAATLVPARRFGDDPSGGAIAVGQPADLVLLKANPLADVAHTQQIEWVISRGALVEPGR